MVFVTTVWMAAGLVTIALRTAAVELTAPFGFPYLVLNTKQGPLANMALRQAVQASLNDADMLAAGFGGLSSWILSGLVSACSSNDVDLVNMSIEGYLDPTDPSSAQTYLLFNDAVSYFLTHPGADADSLAASLCRIFAP